MNATTPASTAPTGAPNPSGPASPAGLIIAAVTGFALVVLATVYAWFVLPRMMVIFEDFNVELPALTVMMINYGGVLLPLIAALIGFGLVLNEVLFSFVPLPAAARWLLRLLPLLAVGLLAVVLVLSIVLPLVGLTESL